ncbi:MAG: hypothetical protein E5V74_01465 [Mesorhizobium sp.]|nr:MAG: hypothetical protein E5W03_01540 [Mesorhizobium sp.]TIV22043.1 MAG: hypothetical protein E5W02_09520 [Mesorhizobium sp.]TIV67145.1 MAG: hypothetical protein E5V86_05945 [Mesorhizobium sp.]TIW05799.1 MAG: hypothetical protein E5V74_01465 [Mesorhizobium sp.]
MVEYSQGYKAQAQARLQELENLMTPQARAVAEGLSEHFANSWSKQSSEAPKNPPANLNHNP